MTRVVFHHAPERRLPTSPTHDEIADQIRIMEDWHARTFDLKEPRLGYQWIIVVPTLEIWEGIGWDRIGAHVRDHNTLSLGVLFLGLDGAKEAGPDAAWRLAADLVREGIRRGSLVQRPELSPHRRYVATSCPGDVLARHVERMTLDELMALSIPTPLVGMEETAPRPAPTELVLPGRVKPLLDRDAAAAAMAHDLMPRAGEPAGRWYCRILASLTDGSEVPMRISLLARVLRATLNCGGSP